MKPTTLTQAEAAILADAAERRVVPELYADARPEMVMAVRDLARTLVVPLEGATWAENTRRTPKKAENRMSPAMRATQDVLMERQKQREKWGDAHDDKRKDEALALAAGTLAGPNGIYDPENTDRPWPMPEWVRDIVDTVRMDRRRELVIAAALLIAEIERLDRAAPMPTPEEE